MDPSLRSFLVPAWRRIVAGFAIAGVLGAGAYFLPVLEAGFNSSAGGGVLGTSVVSSGPFTILLLGSDDDSKFPNSQLDTQSMILVRVDPAQNRATMMSIPRDLWVTMPGSSSKGKIDTAFQDGGAPSAVATVESNFGVHIDDYVWIGLKGLVQLIDRLGGVDLLVSNPVMDDFYPADLGGGDPYGYTRVAVLPGAVHLDGTQALQYVRSRHGDLRGDFARSERQQQILLAIKAQARQLNVADLPDLASAFNGEIKTSMSLDRVRQLYGVAAGLDPSSIKRIVLLPPYTSSDTIDGQDVIVPDWSQILPLVHQAFP